MDSAVHLALEEICCGAANGLRISDLWAKISPTLAARGLPICPNGKREIWENLAEIPGLKLVACDGSASSRSMESMLESSVEKCEEVNAKIVATEAMRRSFLGIYDWGTPETTSADVQRLILERLAVARNNGIAQNDLTKELHIPANILSYQFKTLETQGLIMKQPSVIRKNCSIVTTNMIYLARYAKHLGTGQRLEITRKDQADDVTGPHDDLINGVVADNVCVKDFVPALKAICDKLEKAEGKVLVVSDIKKDLGYRGSHGHKSWRIICSRLKDARVVEECCTLINNKEVDCLRLLRSFSTALLEPKLHGRGPDDIDTEQSPSLLKRGQTTEELVELPILRQIHDMIDATGFKGLTNTEVCRRLGLCSKEYHKRYFKQLLSRFGVHSLKECHKKGEVFRLWTAGNFKPQASDMSLIEGETALQEVDESKSLVVDRNLLEDSSQLVQVLDTNISGGNTSGNNQSENEVAAIAETSNCKTVDDEASSGLLVRCNTHNSDVEQCKEGSSQLVQVLDTNISVGNNSGNNQSENDAVAIAETSNCKTVGDEASSGLLVLCNTHNSDVEQCNGAHAEELLQESRSIPNFNTQESHSLSLIKSPRNRSHPRSSRLAVRATSTLREQRILKILEEEKFLPKAQLHQHLESLEMEKNTAMDRKTLERSLIKLQQEGHCKCIHVSAPGITNCGRSRTSEVVLHPSVYDVSTELLTQIHDKMRYFEVQVRKQSYIRQKKSQSVPILDNVQRIPCIVQDQSEYAGLMRANGFVLAKMVRTRLLHTFLWEWVYSSSGSDHALFSSNHSQDLENPHSSCKSFDLELAIRSMPLGLFLQVVGSTQKSEDVLEESKSSLLLCDLPTEKCKRLLDTRATSRFSLLIAILQRLKLIRLVSKGHVDDGSSGQHATLTHALELKPYLEEPASAVASSGLLVADLRPQVRHDFVLSSKKAVGEYWRTLEYSYAAAKSRAASLAFPGSAVKEVFHPKSWASARTMTANKRVELLKRVAKDGTKMKLSFEMCEKIAEDLDLTLEQVLRVYYDKRQRSVTRLGRVLDAEGDELQTVKGKRTTSSRKRRRLSDRIPSKIVNGHSGVEAAGSSLDPDNQSTMEQGSLSITAKGDDDYQSQRNSASSKAECFEMENLSEEDKEFPSLIHKQALSKLNLPRQKKFSWTEEADRQLVIEYARHRAARGAKFHRVDWVSISSLPAPPEACRRRMALLNSFIPFRDAVMKLCTMLSENYAKYLDKFQDKTLSPADSGKMIRGPTSGEASAERFERWANFDEDATKVALEDVLRCKRMAKLDAARETFQEQENSEDDDIEDCGQNQVSGQRQLLRKLNTTEGTKSSRQMQESVAIANAAELFKLIFLSKSTAPEAPTLLAKTLRHYSEHDLFAAFNYLRDKKIMAGGSKGPFVLSQHFLLSISSSSFPIDTGSRAAKFAIWLQEREKDLIEEDLEVPSDLQCGEVFSLCALVSSGELSITPYLPSESVGEAEDSRPKRKSDSSEPAGGLSKKLRKTYAGEGEMISRREKGFPGIKLSLHREMISRLLAIDSFRDGNMYPAPFRGGKDQSNTLCGLDANSSLLHSDVADHASITFDSDTTVHHILDVSESPWEAMTSYAKHLLSSCSRDVNSSLFQPDLFRTLYSAIQKSGDNGLSLKEIHKVLNINDEKILEATIDVLGAFRLALKVNAYNSIHVVDSLYRSKYFLTNIHDHAAHHLKRKRKTENKAETLDLNNKRESLAALVDEIHTNDNEEHRVTILNRPEDVIDPSSIISMGNDITDHQQSEAAPAEINIVEILKSRYTDAHICRPLLPWMNGDGTIHELVYKGLLRRVLGIVMLNPGILEDEIINQMHGLNPQSCRLLLETMVLDKHISTRKMQQMTAGGPPSILGNLIGGKYKKRKLISRVHYFANPSSTTLL